MTPLQRYIAEEIATDHVDGLLSRREALRRLALLGVGTAAATALITACGQNRQQSADTTTSSEPAPTPSPSSVNAAPPPGMDAELPTTAITWAGPDGELQGAWAAAGESAAAEGGPAPEPRGGILVIHENKGLNDWTRSVAGRLAGAGYSSLAIDLLSERGGTATFADPAEATAALGNRAPEDMVADLKSGIAEVQSRTPGKKVGAVGFCMGGGLVWRLLAAGTPELSAAFPFYGELDQRVNATEPAAKAALEKAGLVHELVTEPGANHAFFNDTGDRYDATAAADAWTRTLDWLHTHVG